MANISQETIVTVAATGLMVYLAYEHLNNKGHHTKEGLKLPSINIGSTAGALGDLKGLVQKVVGGGRNHEGNDGGRPRGRGRDDDDERGGRGGGRGRGEGRPRGGGRGGGHGGGRGGGMGGGRGQGEHDDRTESQISQRERIARGQRRNTRVLHSNQRIRSDQDTTR